MVLISFLFFSVIGEVSLSSCYLLLEAAKYYSPFYTFYLLTACIEISVLNV